VRPTGFLFDHLVGLQQERLWGRDAEYPTLELPSRRNKWTASVADQKAELATPNSNSRFAPESGLKSDIAPCLRNANTDLYRPGRPNVGQAYFLHCPLFLRSCIVIWHHELQPVRAVPAFPLLQMLIQVLTSQLAASVGGANAKDSPQTSSMDSNARKTRDMNTSGN
jgi:hypothetical protein